ncbi:MAG: phage integrase central domain-containing protein [Campylobacter sp.]
MKERTAQNQTRNAQKYLFPYLGQRDISGITATYITEVLRKVEDAGGLSVVKKLFQFCGQL